MIPTVDSSITVVEPAADHRIVLEAVTGNLVERVEVEGETCLIGRAEFCELQVDGPLVHSEIHCEHGALWIESGGEHELEINGRRCRRLALREGDTIRLSDTTITVRIDPPIIDEFHNDLGELSASELCDRIECEQAAVTEFERKRLTGWEALLRQMEDTIHLEPGATADVRIDQVVGQLHGLADKLAARTQELAAQEAMLLESAGELKRTQDLMAGRLERVLQQFQDGELRASA